MKARNAILAAAVAAACSASAIEPWRTPEVNSINRLPARAIAVPCESAEKALAVAGGDAERTESEYLSSLDGTWDFRWKHDVYAPHWEKTGKIAVPGCWQLQGDYDPPLYTNVRYPIADNGTGDPMVEPPEDFTSHYYRNPVGLYSRTFHVPESWKGRRVVVHFGGVSSAMYVRLNGVEIGYSEDSRLPAEFDLTPHLKFGGGLSSWKGTEPANVLEVEVLKHCDGTFLEDQDFWRLSGIFRSVWLVAEKPEAEKDLVVEATLSDDYGTGRLAVRDENGAVVFEKEYAKPRLWTCETPNLYREAFQTKGGDWRAVSFGFRKVEIRGAVLYLNGRRIVFKGVNRHEMEPSTGYSVTREGMERDIAIMRDLNINAVRTCHYPDVPEWYELCDRNGIYVVCEANIESHGAGYRERTYAIKPAFLQTHVERGVNMVRTFRNHPSILIWSLGNEAGDGPNFTAEYKAIKELDPTRPVQYERASNGDNTDIRCPMYMRPWDVEKYVRDDPKKPFVLCEYSHAMGNSNGGIQRYWDLERRYPSMQGGFVWDFVDQALWKTDWRGTWLAYGGDFGDRPNDDNFNCNGLVAADRTYHPGAFEVKHAYQPVRVDAYDWKSGVAKIHNDYAFVGLSNVTGWWTLEKGGEKVAEGKLDLSGIAPASSKDVATGARDAGDAMTFRFYSMPDGREIAHDQFSKPFVPVAPVPAADAAVRGAASAPRAFDPATLRPDFWRAPTDNDRGWKIVKKCRTWKDATEYGYLPEGVESVLSTRPDGDGRTLVDWTLTVASTNLPPIPRVGLSFTIPRGFSRVRWYGLGPWENYSDRATGALLGRWEANVGVSSGLADPAIGAIRYVEDGLNPDNYTEPGEQGHRGGCRSVEFSDGNGRRVRITALNAPFGFNAWPYSQLSLERAKHQFDLADEGRITVVIDAAQTGVGGDNSWGAHTENMLGAGEYRLSFLVEEL